MKRTIIALLLMLNLSVQATPSQSEHILWDKTPIVLELPINQERLIHFPQTLTFSYDAGKLNEETLQVTNVSGTLYLKALKEFEVTRAQVTLHDGTVILLDLKAQAVAPTNSLHVLLPSPNEVIANKPEHRVVGYVALMRYAIQQLYAPSRVLSRPDGIQRIPMQTARLVALHPHPDVKAMPLATYKDANHYVTSVLFRNLTDDTILLYPKALRGDFKAVVFYPSQTLKPKGNPQDSTTVFLITDKPFAMSIH